MIFPNVKVQPHWLKTLEAAVEILPDCWLCVAIDFCIEPKIEKEIREAIERAIEPPHIIDCWLACEMGTDLVTWEESKEYRTAWLNHMIEQCRSMQPKEQI